MRIDDEERRDLENRKKIEKEKAQNFVFSDLDQKGNFKNKEKIVIEKAEEVKKEDFLKEKIQNNEIFDNFNVYFIKNLSLKKIIKKGRRI